MSVEIVKAKPQAPSKFLVIGEPFSGKTTLAAKAPKPLFISTDGNAAKMGLDAINVKSVSDIRESVELVMKGKAYKTLVIDTIEGVTDLFTEDVLNEYNRLGFRTAEGKELTALADVPYGKLTGVFNKRLTKFADALAKLDMNVVILSYTKKRQDEVTQSIVLDSELKNIRFFTRFMDAQIITTFDGEKHKASIISKREIMAGEVAIGEIEPFLAAIGWTLPKKSVRLGKAQKR